MVPLLRAWLRSYSMVQDANVREVQIVVTMLVELLQWVGWHTYWEARHSPCSPLLFRGRSSANLEFVAGTSGQGDSEAS